jgi:hypothetical protein
MKPRGTRRKRVGSAGTALVGATFRRIVSVGSGALALAAVLIGPATAAVTGSVNCMLRRNLMMLRRVRMLTALVALTVLPLVALAPGAVVNAADHTILGKRFQVRDPQPGVYSTRRKVVGQGKETHSLNTIVGDPTVKGDKSCSSVS